MYTHRRSISSSCSPRSFAIRLCHNRGNAGPSSEPVSRSTTPCGREHALFSKRSSGKAEHNPLRTGSLTMSEYEAISRRKALSFGLAALFSLAAPPTLLMVSEAEAQQPAPMPAPAPTPRTTPPADTTPGTERRQERRRRRQARRAGRRDRRRSRRAGRRDRRQARRTSRRDRRQDRREGRGERRQERRN